MGLIWWSRRWLEWSNKGGSLRRLNYRVGTVQTGPMQYDLVPDTILIHYNTNVSVLFPLLLPPFHLTSLPSPPLSSQIPGPSPGPSPPPLPLSPPHTNPPMSPLLHSRPLPTVPLPPTSPAVKIPRAACTPYRSVVAADDAPGVDFGVCVGLLP